jgi:hypothetical protein
MENGAPLPVNLTEEEREVLLKGLMEWNGPARPTVEFAIAMGFTSATTLPAECLRIYAALDRGDSLVPLDWARALLATEVAFASAVVGSGHQWSTTTGLKDDVTIGILRAVQRKLVRTVVAPVIGNGLGTTPERHY